MVVQRNTNNTTLKGTNKANQTKALNSTQEPKIKGGNKKPLNADQLSELQVGRKNMVGKKDLTAYFAIKYMDSKTPEADRIYLEGVQYGN